jgi:hypothetical protein
MGIVGNLTACVIFFFVLLLWQVHKYKSFLKLTLAALICFYCPVFFFIYPVSRVAINWSVLPQNWVQLRTQWEYLHAINVLLELIAFTLLLTANLKGKKEQPGS